MSFAHLPTLADMQQKRRATPKHKIVPRLVEREEKKKAKALNEDTLRKGVWARDKSLCRATGAPLVKSGTIDDKKLGEVDHALLRSTNPDKVYDITNGVLIQKYLNRLRKTACRNAPQFRMFDYDGPADRGKPQKFVWRDPDGNIIKTRIG